MAVLAWHFLASKNGEPVTRDGKVVKVGDVETVEGELQLCKWGLHGSVKAFDAFAYAPGPWVQRTEHSGKILLSKDKLVSQTRQCLALAYADSVLNDFAIWCVEQAFLNDSNPDPEAITALQAKKDWLAGKISEDDLYEIGGKAHRAVWARGEPKFSTLAAIAASSCTSFLSAIRASFFARGYTLVRGTPYLKDAMLGLVMYNKFAEEFEQRINKLLEQS